jgi:hypothetical protein
MRGYDRNSMCYECGGKPGEHGEKCSFGFEISERNANIEIENERRRRECHDAYVQTHLRHCYHCGYEGPYVESCICPTCHKFADVRSVS